MYIFKLKSDPHQGREITYLHGRSLAKDEYDNNPTGAVIVPISLATTFKQSTLGQTTLLVTPTASE